MSDPDSFIAQMLAGVDRNLVHWNPTILEEMCTQCGLCLNFCNRNVYTQNGVKIEVTNPTNCMLFCDRCADMCPNHAIMHPTKKNLLKEIREFRKK